MRVSGTDCIAHAAQLLKSGELVAFPTETVYGLGADASNESAIKKLYEVKGRPSNHPVIVHVLHHEQLTDWAADVPETAQLLAKAFMPGPLTLVLRKAPHVSALLTGGQDTIAVRMPAHPVARAVLYAFRGGIAAPSANRYGNISPTTVKAVREEFGDAIYVVPGGQSDVGLESTIIDVTSEKPRVLRPGMISLAQIEAVIGTPLIGGETQNAPRVPGAKRSHYAPKKPLKLVADATMAMESAVIARRAQPVEFRGDSWTVLPAKASGYARELYRALRDADNSSAPSIALELPPHGPEWNAVHDRLQRAATPREEDE